MSVFPTYSYTKEANFLLFKTIVWNVLTLELIRLLVGLFFGLFALSYSDIAGDISVFDCFQCVHAESNSSCLGSDFRGIASVQAIDVSSNGIWANNNLILRSFSNLGITVRGNSVIDAVGVSEIDSGPLGVSVS